MILEIEIQGALKIKKQFPDTVLMFVSAPSADELRDRFVGRAHRQKRSVHTETFKEHMRSLWA